MVEKDYRHGHRQRLRDRFKEKGGDSFQDYELIELLLTYTVPRKDVKPIAKELLKRFNSIAELLDASVEEISECDGIGAQSALIFNLLKCISERYLAESMQEQNVLSSPEKVIDFARMKLIGMSAEAFMAIYLNTKNHVIESIIENRGTINHTTVYPREIIKNALRLNASGVIIVHNHPSGECDPSSSDIKLTRTMKDALDIVGLRLLDHLIVGRAGHYSFSANSLL